MVVSKDVIAAGWHGMLGKGMLVGTVTLDGGNPTPIDLSANFTSIDWAMAVGAERSTAPGIDPHIFTYVISGTTIIAVGVPLLRGRLPRVHVVGLRQAPSVKVTAV